MYPVSPQAYDRATSVFSPDGSLYQVEYAKEAVKRGATAFGIRAKEGVVLGAHKPLSSPLIEEESVKKVFQIDGHIAMCASGVISDARRLIDFARLEAQKYRLMYEERVPPSYLAAEIGNLMQSYTQIGGLRPFGVAFIIGGMNRKKPELYEIVPSGAITGYRAVAIGKDKKPLEKVFEKEMAKKNEISLKQALSLAVKAIKTLKPSQLDRFELGIIDEKGIRMLSWDEIKKLLQKVK